MQVTIKGESKYIPVTTITLQPVEIGVTFPFHCINCGWIHSVIGGNVTKISPIVEPTNQIPVITTCRSCKARFTFQDDMNGNTPEVISVLLNPIKEKKPFYCYLGGGENKLLNKILEYEKGYIYSTLTGKYMKTPFIATCGNKECSVIYEFTELS